MTEQFKKASRTTPEGSNAQDPNADRLGAYSEAGELQSPQGAVDRDATGPDAPEPAGIDAELIFTGGPGRSLGGPNATDRPGDRTAEQPGEGAPRPDEAGSEDDRPAPAPFVDRLR